MNSLHPDTQDSRAPAVILGDHIRRARKSRGWTISELADKLGRQREWLNRVELGYSEFGEYKPPSLADVQTMVEMLKDNFKVTAEELADLAFQAQKDYDAIKLNVHKNKRSSFGKLTQTEVIVGEKQIVQAILDLIKEQHSDAIIRNTGIKSLGSYQNVTADWKNYRVSLGEFLEANPNALFKRVEYAANESQLALAKEADKKLNGKRDLKEVHNAKVKFHRHNPLQLHVVIGQREAILALPQTSGQAGSNVAILVRDRIFVEALRVWYDEVLWDAPGPSLPVDFAKFDESFDDIKDMYGF